MKETEGLRPILQKIYRLLDFRQKRNFVFIIIIMIVSAGLTQLTPKAVGQLTDDILVGDQVDFFRVIPFLIFILPLTSLPRFPSVWTLIILAF